MPFTASPTNEPHDAYGACTPSPRKERNDSVMMNDGILSVENTMITLSEFGTRWRMMIRQVGAPMERAASMNSWFFKDMICPRTIRLMVSQLMMASAKNRFSMFLPNTAMAIMTSSIYGRPYMMSTMRMMM